MAHVALSQGKRQRLQACANAHGLFTVVAVDHRTPLAQGIAAARGQPGSAGAEDVAAFKAAVTRVLGPHASALILDPEYSLGVIPQKPAQTGLLLAYEKTGYDPASPARLPSPLPAWSVRRLAERGADGIKFLLYYNPFDADEINEDKRAFVERLGAECAALDMPLYLEPVTYDERLGPADGPAYARRKPEYVRRAIEEFSQPRYGVDVLKVQAPADPQYVAGAQANAGHPALFGYAEALDHYRAAAAAARQPLIFLSGGARDEVFLEALSMAAAAHARFAGVACGRATWQEGVGVYARQGLSALEDWLAREGLRRIQALHTALAAGAAPWWEAID